MKLKRASLIGLLACLTILLSGWACSGTEVHKANRAGKQIADDIHELEAQAEAEYSLGNLSKDEATALVNLASQASLADDSFEAKVKTLAVLDGSNAAQVTGWLNELVAEVDKLNDEGVLHIKDPKTKAKFDLLYQSISAGLSTLQILLQGLSTPNPPTNSTQFPYPAPMHAGLDAEGIAALLMAFSSITKLILQARADGSLTDEQLQDAAAVENLDTRAHAAAFVAMVEGKS